MTTSSVTELHRLIIQGAGICLDSRKATPGSLFFALKGEHFDGNKFAAAALKQGSILAVVDDPALKGRENHLVVDNVLQSLQQLAVFHRSQFHVPVIGITGSNGKTTTKELTHRVLARKFLTNATAGNLNNHIGVPLTLLSWKQPLEMCIVEMGANHVGEIEALAKLAMPGFGIITNIGKAHLEGFGSIENIAKGKGELYDFVRSHGGTLFVNTDHPKLVNMIGGANVVKYGTADQNHCSGTIIESFPLVKMHFRTNQAFGQASRGIEGIINSRITGGYNAENILTALTIGLYFGVPLQEIIDAIESYEPVNHRSQIIQTPHNSIIMDAYNANPTSMSAAIENFSQFSDLPRVVILGDMLELGEDSPAEHAAMVQKVLQQGYELVIFVGPLFQKAITPDDGVRDFNHVDEAARWLMQNPIQGRRILIKGSRGIALEKLIQHL